MLDTDSKVSSVSFTNLAPFVTKSFIFENTPDFFTSTSFKFVRESNSSFISFSKSSFELTSSSISVNSKTESLNFSISLVMLSAATFY